MSLKIEILYGLPGAGKTTYAEKRCKEDNVFYFDGDSFLKDSHKKSIIPSINNIIAQLQGYRNPKETKTVIVDGLFTKENVIQLYDAFDYVKIIRFTSEKSLCIANDESRYQETSRQRSVGRINDSKLESFQESLYNVEHVQTETPYFVDSIIKFYDLSYDTIESSTWDAGGSTYHTCWDDEDTEHTPTMGEMDIKFEEFDELKFFLTNFSGSIPSTIELLMYSDLAVIDDRTEGDWYGGTEYQRFWTISIRDVVARYYDFEVTERTQIVRDEKPGLYIKAML